MKIKNVRHTGIVVSDIERSIRFYTELLGFKIEKDMLESGTYIDNFSDLVDAEVRTVKICGRHHRRMPVSRARGGALRGRYRCTIGSASGKDSRAPAQWSPGGPSAGRAGWAAACFFLFFQN